MKLGITDLSGLFIVIENTVSKKNMPERQKPKWIKLLRMIAKVAYDLGKNGKAEIEI